VSVPAASVTPLKVPGFTVLQDPAANITWIAIQHGGGAWKLRLEPGSSAIAKVRDASLLPEPHITGRVSGSGRERVLTWRLRPSPRQRVVFWEKGHDVARVIGSTTAGRGSLRFTAASSNSRRRSIEAQVFSFGHPRADITVAHFVAPPPARPGRPKALHVAAAGGGAIRISWKGAPHAGQFVIQVVTGGARLVQYAGARTHSVVIHNVEPITAATVRVTAQTLTGVAGGSASARFPDRGRHHGHHSLKS
jgi:hypothetical protein